MTAETYLNQAMAIARQAVDSQLEAVREAAELVAEAMAEGKTFWVFGTGHSHVIAEELYGRAATPYRWSSRSARAQKGRR